MLTVGQMVFPDLQRIFPLSCVYALTVFTTGFCFGVIRQLYFIPYFGLSPSIAKIMELPAMFVAIVVCSNWVVNGWDVKKGWNRILLGCMALLIMILIEFAGSQYVGEEAPIDAKEEMWKGIAKWLYWCDLGAFGLMPFILGTLEKDGKKEE